MSYLEKATSLQQMVGQGQSLEACQQFYHTDVTVVEANGEVRKGRDAQLNAIQEWMGSVQEMHGGGIGAITANEEAGMTMAETWVEVTFKDGNRMKLEEVAVQKWEGDHIIHERFYYNIPGM